jgi:hypothetical protein
LPRPYFDLHLGIELEADLEVFQNVGVDFFARNNAGSSLLYILALKKAESRHDEDFAYAEIVKLFKMLMVRGLDPMVEDAR